jgi:hypothetical protein
MMRIHGWGWAALRRSLVVAALSLAIPAVGWGQAVRYWPQATGGGDGTWGSITGTLGDQSDLAAALAAAGADPALFSSPGGDVVIGGTPGAVTLDVDSSTIPHFASGTATVSGNCTIGDMYLETDRNIVSVCSSTNVWSTMSNFQSGTADPGATCSLGDFYFETDQYDLYFCSLADTWSLIPSHTSATDDSVMVGDGTTFGLEAVPDCDDSGGNHLNYDTATNAWSCGTSGGSSFDPGTTFDLYEEFVSGSLTTTNTIGSTGVTVNLVSSGTVAQVAGTATNPGQLQLKPSNTDESGATMFWNSSSLFNASIWTDYAWTLDGVVGYAGAVANTAFWFGLSSGASTLTSASAGIWITRNTALGHGAFVAAVCDTNAASGCQAAGDDTDQQSQVSTITPSVATTGYRFRITHEPTGGPGSTRKISMRVNDETAITFCSSTCTETIDDLPAVALIPVIGQFAKEINGATWFAEVDYLRLTVTGLARY